MDLGESEPRLGALSVGEAVRLPRIPALSEGYERPVLSSAGLCAVHYRRAD